MPKAIFETRFFVYFFASPDLETHRKLLRLMDGFRPRFVSAITLFEIYKLSLEREGKEMAETRVARIRREFQVVPVTGSIAVRGAQLKHAAKVRSNEDIPMADSLIGATSLVNRALCISDSPHFDKMPQVKRKWI